MEILKIKQADGSEKAVILPIRGMVGTLCTGSDLYTICCNVVLNNKKVGIVRIIGITEDNKDQYIYEKDGAEYLTDEAFDKFVNPINTLHFSLRKNGTWYSVGTRTESRCPGIIFGHAYPHLTHEF